MFVFLCRSKLQILESQQYSRLPGKKKNFLISVFLFPWPRASCKWLQLQLMRDTSQISKHGHACACPHMRKLSIFLSILLCLVKCFVIRSPPSWAKDEAKLKNSDQAVLLVVCLEYQLNGFHHTGKHWTLELLIYQLHQFATHFVLWECQDKHTREQLCIKYTLSLSLALCFNLGVKIQYVCCFAHRM